jgi:hypothetical protein
MRWRIIFIDQEELDGQVRREPVSLFIQDRKKIF